MDNFRSERDPSVWSHTMAPHANDDVADEMEPAQVASGLNFTRAAARNEILELSQYKGVTLPLSKSYPILDVFTYGEFRDHVDAGSWTYLPVHAGMESTEIHHVDLANKRLGEIRHKLHSQREISASSFDPVRHSIHVHGWMAELIGHADHWLFGVQVRLYDVSRNMVTEVPVVLDGNHRINALKEAILAGAPLHGTPENVRMLLGNELPCEALDTIVNTRNEAARQVTDIERCTDALMDVFSEQLIVYLSNVYSTHESVRELITVPSSDTNTFWDVRAPVLHGRETCAFLEALVLGKITHGLHVIIKDVLCRRLMGRVTIGADLRMMLYGTTIGSTMKDTQADARMAEREEQGEASMQEDEEDNLDDVFLNEQPDTGSNSNHQFDVARTHRLLGGLCGFAMSFLVGCSWADMQFDDLHAQEAEGDTQQASGERQVCEVNRIVRNTAHIATFGYYLNDIVQPTVLSKQWRMLVDWFATFKPYAQNAWHEFCKSRDIAGEPSAINANLPLTALWWSLPACAWFIARCLCEKAQTKKTRSRFGPTAWAKIRNHAKMLVCQFFLGSVCLNTAFASVSACAERDGTRARIALRALELVVFSEVYSHTRVAQDADIGSSSAWVAPFPEVLNFHEARLFNALNVEDLYDTWTDFSIHVLLSVNIMASSSTPSYVSLADVCSQNTIALQAQAMSNWIHHDKLFELLALSGTAANEARNSEPHEHNIRAGPGNLGRASERDDACERDETGETGEVGETGETGEIAELENESGPQSTSPGDDAGHPSDVDVAREANTAGDGDGQFDEAERDEEGVTAGPGEANSADKAVHESAAVADQTPILKTSDAPGARNAAETEEPVKARDKDSMDARVEPAASVDSASNIADAHESDAPVQASVDVRTNVSDAHILHITLTTGETGETGQTGQTGQTDKTAEPVNKGGPESTRPAGDAADAADAAHAADAGEAGGTADKVKVKMHAATTAARTTAALRTYTASPPANAARMVTLTDDDTNTQPVMSKKDKKGSSTGRAPPETSDKKRSHDGQGDAPEKVHKRRVDVTSSGTTPGKIGDASPSADSRKRALHFAARDSQQVEKTAVAPRRNQVGSTQRQIVPRRQVVVHAQPSSQPPKRLKTKSQTNVPTRASTENVQRGAVDAVVPGKEVSASDIYSSMTVFPYSN